CALREGADFVQKQVQEADEAVKRQEYGAAMFALGKALHALQDFYSHTNYVEKMAQGTGSFAEVQIVPLWTDPGRARLEALLAQGLASGVVSYSDLKACPAGAPDHHEVAKDTADFNDLARKVVPRWQNRSHYTAALDLAGQATEAFLTWAFQRWPRLSENCGRFLGYAAPGDRRRPEMPR
ncbi:MAG TPA: HET-C-related protein, partial [Thermoanaerobaculia bacterium]|nr:HET-C-related protein [Thermoanaerobaculia bacterium]